MSRKKLLWFILFVSSISILIACNDTVDPIKPTTGAFSKYNTGEIMWAWNDHYLFVDDHIAGFRPPVSARALAYLGLIAYESVAPGLDEGQSLVASKFPSIVLPQIEKGVSYHWGVSLNQAYYAGIRSLMARIPAQDYIRADSIHNAYEKKLASECDAATFERSKTFGRNVAQQILSYSFEDGQALAFLNNKPLNYVPPVGPGLWRSTLPDTLRALTPLWGKVRPFVITNEDRIMKAPLAYSVDKKSEFYKQAKEVYDEVKNASKEDIWIAEYWSDDASTYTIDAAARWLSIANQAMKLKKTNLEQSVIITAKLGLMLHDATVACWDNKYKYNVLRPYTYITETIDPTWKTLLRDPTKKAGQQIGVTPQHPSYPSGHSVFGQAAAEVLIAELGDKINLTDRTNEGETYYDYRPRTFKTFTAMAKENAYSRIKLGVHFRMDCDEGLALGKKVGTRINSLPWRKPVL